MTTRNHRRPKPGFIHNLAAMLLMLGVVGMICLTSRLFYLLVTQ